MIVFYCKSKSKIYKHIIFAGWGGGAGISELFYYESKFKIIKK